MPGKSHGQRNVVGCSPGGCEKSDTTERLHFHFSLSCIGEGNGNPLQCSYLGNPRNGGACGLPSMGSHRVGHNQSDLASYSPQGHKESDTTAQLSLFKNCLSNLSRVSVNNAPQQNSKDMLKRLYYWSELCHNMHQDTLKRSYTSLVIVITLLII